MVRYRRRTFLRERGEEEEWESEREFRGRKIMCARMSVRECVCVCVCERDRE